MSGLVAIDGPSHGNPPVHPRTLVAVSYTQPHAVARLATVTGRAEHPAVRWVAHCLGGVPVDEHPRRDLAAVPVPNPSAAVGAAVGTASVAEAAALASAPGGRLVVAKRKSATVTVAVAAAVAVPIEPAAVPGRPGSPFSPALPDPPRPPDSPAPPADPAHPQGDPA